jgi:replicative DNA helicase
MSDNLLQNLEIEQHAVGAALTNPAIYTLASEYLTAADFGYLRTRRCWNAMRLCSEQETDFDYATIAKRLHDDGTFADDGWGMNTIVAFLMECINNTPTSANGELYTRLVETMARRRELMQYGDQVKILALDEDLPLPKVMETAEGLIRNLASKTVKRSEVTIGDALSAAMDSIEARQGSQQEFYLPTGYKAIDQFCSGLERGSVHVIGGKPAMGKTSLCMGIAVGGARVGVRTAFISNEMLVDSLGMRIASIESAVNLQALKRGEITEQEYSRFVEAVGRIQSIPLTLDYIPGTTIQQLHAKVLRWKREQGVDVVIIDGLWRMQALEFSGDKSSRNEIHGYLMDSLSEIAKAQNIAIVVTHQCTKAIDYRQDKRPTRGDLDYGGKIDQSADLIIMLYRDEVYNEATEFPGQADLIVDKNRDGPAGTITMYFDKRTTRFLDASPVSVNLSSKTQQPVKQEKRHERANPAH